MPPFWTTGNLSRGSGLAAARGAAGGLLALYSGAAARGARLAHRSWWLPGWVFAAITQAPAVLAVAWLVPGAGMLLAGRLLPLPMVIIFVPLAVALCYFAMRRLPVSWPRGMNAGEAGVARRRPDVPAAAVAAMIVIAAGFGVWQALLRSEQVFVASDPGVYLQYGYWIAGHGTARIPESAAAFGGSGGLDFATPGFIVSGGWITPGYLPGLPLLLAAGTWLGGLGGALLMPAVLGGCAVLSFAGLVGRLCGMWWGVAGELLLAICLPEVYASRTPFSEPLVQVLLFGGLCLFLDSLVVRHRGVGGSGDRHGRPGRFDGEVALAALGGLALGLTVLASIGSLGMLLPAFPVVAVLFVARRPQAGPFGGGLIFGIGMGLVTGLVLARPYLASVSEQLHLIGRVRGRLRRGNGPDRAACVARRAIAGTAGVRRPAQPPVVQPGAGGAAVARVPAHRAGRGAAGARARRAGRPAVPADRARADRSGRDQPGRGAATAAAAAGRRDAPVLRVQPVVGGVVHRAARPAAGVPGDDGARAAAGTRGVFAE